MIGKENNEGIMHRILNDLFEHIDKNKINKDIKIKVSYLEIYNENIKDLMSPDDKNLDLREDPMKGITIAGISELKVETTKEIMKLLKVGNKNRSKGNLYFKKNN